MHAKICTFVISGTGKGKRCTFRGSFASYECVKVFLEADLLLHWSSTAGSSFLEQHDQRKALNNIKTLNSARTNTVARVKDGLIYIPVLSEGSSCQNVSFPFLDTF